MSLFDPSPKLLWVVVWVLIILQLVTLAVALNSPNGKSYPKEETTSYNVELDYDKISQIVQQKMSQLPIPTNGSDGKSIVGPRGAVGPSEPAQHGVNGQDAKPCTAANNESGEAVIKCPDGSEAVVKPKPGERGESGKTPEFRCLNEARRIDVRFSPDDSWQIFLLLSPLEQCP